MSDTELFDWHARYSWLLSQVQSDELGKKLVCYQYV